MLFKLFTCRPVGQFRRRLCNNVSGGKRRTEVAFGCLLTQEWCLPCVKKELQNRTPESKDLKGPISVSM